MDSNRGSREGWMLENKKWWRMGFCRVRHSRYFFACTSINGNRYKMLSPGTALYLTSYE